MAFPPVFDNVWDITTPPDTQLANLLGQDLRNLKDDVMQRMSLLSGTLANRPTPESVNATWGGAGFGLIYIATDTAQTFQWNGGAWVSIIFGTSPFHISNVVPVNLLANGNGQSVIIPGGTLLVGSVARIRAHWHINGIGTGNPGLNLFFGATSIVVSTFGGVGADIYYDATVFVTAAAIEKSFAITYQNSNPPLMSGGFLSPTEAIAGAITVKSNISGSQTGFNITSDFLDVTIGS